MTDNTSAGIINTFGDPRAAANLAEAPATIDYDLGTLINQYVVARAEQLMGRGNVLFAGSILTDPNNIVDGYEQLRPEFQALADAGGMRWQDDPSRDWGGGWVVTDQAGFNAAFNAVVAANGGVVFDTYEFDERGFFVPVSTPEQNWNMLLDRVGANNIPAIQAELFAYIQRVDRELETAGFRTSSDLNFTELGPWRLFEMLELGDYLTGMASDFEGVRQLNVFAPGFPEGVQAVVRNASDLGLDSMTFNIVAERMTIEEITTSPSTLDNVIERFLPRLDDGSIDRAALASLLGYADAAAMSAALFAGTAPTDDEIEASLRNLATLGSDYRLYGDDPAVLNRADPNYAAFAILNAIRPHQEAYDLTANDWAGQGEGDLLTYLGGGGHAFAQDVLDIVNPANPGLNSTIADIRDNGIATGSESAEFLDALKHAIPLTAALEEHRAINAERIANGQEPIALSGQFMEAIYHYGLGALPLSNGTTVLQYLQDEAQAGRFSFITEGYYAGAEGTDLNIFDGDITVESLIAANAGTGIPVTSLVDVRSIDGAVVDGVVDPQAVARHFEAMLEMGIIPIASSTPDNTGLGDQQLTPTRMTEQYLAAVDAFYETARPIEINGVVYDSPSLAVQALAPNNADMPGYVFSEADLALRDLRTAIDAQLSELGIVTSGPVYNTLMFGENGLFTAIEEHGGPENLMEFVTEQALQMTDYPGYMEALRRTDALEVQPVVAVVEPIVETLDPEIPEAVVPPEASVVEEPEPVIDPVGEAFAALGNVGNDGIVFTDDGTILLRSDTGTQQVTVNGISYTGEFVTPEQLAVADVANLAALGVEIADESLEGRMHASITELQAALSGVTLDSGQSSQYVQRAQEQQNDGTTISR
jgi:hypothetical protein